ncbi:hypothetical protein K1719_040559 [Acacia pycnantha]|nr:hypothetical protein K1719_040559 [Acacia pycnantha]
MPAGHGYFQQDNLDIFRANKPCLNVCAITIASDVRGKDKGWYLDYVEISITGLSSEPTTVSFSVNQWLSLDK